MRCSVARRTHYKYSVINASPTSRVNFRLSPWLQNNRSTAPSKPRGGCARIALKPLSSQVAESILQGQRRQTLGATTIPSVCVGYPPPVRTNGTLVHEESQPLVSSANLVVKHTLRCAHSTPSHSPMARYIYVCMLRSYILY